MSERNRADFRLSLPIGRRVYFWHPFGPSWGWALRRQHREADGMSWTVDDRGRPVTAPQPIDLPDRSRP